MPQPQHDNRKKVDLSLFNLASKSDVNKGLDDESAQRYLSSAPPKVLDSHRFISSLPKPTGTRIDMNACIIHPLFKPGAIIFDVYQNQLKYIAEFWKQVCESRILGNSELETPLLIEGDHAIYIIRGGIVETIRDGQLQLLS